MAYITVVSGGAQPVFATDVLNGNPAQTANLANAAVTNFQGPKLDFFTLVANTALTGTVGNAGGYVSNVLQAIQQTSTVAMYQVGSGAQNANIVVALYPVGAYTTATFVAAAQTANASGGLNIGIPTANVFAQGTFITQGQFYNGNIA
jgi:hypothetical protein